MEADIRTPRGWSFKLQLNQLGSIFGPRRPFLSEPWFPKGIIWTKHSTIVVWDSPVQKNTQCHHYIPLSLFHLVIPWLPDPLASSTLISEVKHRGAWKKAGLKQLKEYIRYIYIYKYISSHWTIHDWSISPEMGMGVLLDTNLSIFPEFSYTTGNTNAPPVPPPLHLSQKQLTLLACQHAVAPWQTSIEGLKASQAELSLWPETSYTSDSHPL